MRIEITSRGIYGQPSAGNPTGEIAVGTELTVKREPEAWAGRYRVLSDAKGKTPVTADEPKPALTPAEVLALADTAHFMTFKAEATKLLGDKAPGSKAEIITALEELATNPA